ncbi:McrC family protein [Tenacibaculum crassostreae]|uniref:McrC family protein n=1 Tax=Tenacibaculum crassostreae TaxID=502683 RepID=UPI003893E014
METNLFEYKNREQFSEKRFEELEIFLDEVWSKREKSSNYTNEEDSKAEVQRFLQFFHKDKTLKSNKYVGVIHFERDTINLLPKIFFNPKENEKPNVKAINKHILWWLSYCRKLRFPNYLSGLHTDKADFFEILIYLFGKYTRELLNSSIYQTYTEVNEELSFVKGRIGFNAYINNNLAKGRFHKVSCEFDTFEMDNEFNRGVKFVAKLLLPITKENQSKRFLSDILFILDEVSDTAISSTQLKRLSFNPMFSNFETVRDYCVLFLENSVSFNYKNDLKLFAFLLPMEYVFEDFIFGFIDKEIEEVNAEYQNSSKYLDVTNNFKLKPDLILKLPLKKIIADTKYKIVYEDETDPKKGISQTDLYQMVSYAIRFNLKEIILFYPNTINNEILNDSAMEVIDELANNETIKIKMAQLPIINFEMFNETYLNQNTLEHDFLVLKDVLVSRIKDLLNLNQ